MNRNGLGSALGAGFMHGSIGRAVVFKWMFTQELSQVYLWIFRQETCHYCGGELVKFNWPSRRAGPYLFLSCAAGRALNYGNTVSAHFQVVVL